MRRLVGEVVADYDERALTSSLRTLSDPRTAARAVYDAVGRVRPAAAPSRQPDGRGDLDQRWGACRRFGASLKAGGGLGGPRRRERQPPGELLIPAAGEHRGDDLLLRVQQRDAAGQRRHRPDALRPALTLARLCFCCGNFASTASGLQPRRSGASRSPSLLTVCGQGVAAPAEAGGCQLCRDRIHSNTTRPGVAEQDMQRVTDWAAARPDRFPFAARPAGRGGIRSPGRGLTSGADAGPGKSWLASRPGAVHVRRQVQLRPEGQQRVPVEPVEPDQVERSYRLPSAWSGSRLRATARRRGSRTCAPPAPALLGPPPVRLRRRSACPAVAPLVEAHVAPRGRARQPGARART
jgi:hypothetical protein